jgi:serine/threonine-protein kinase
VPILTDEERIGRLVGNYRLDRVLGKGGMGVVYAATHHRIPQLRGAVKFLQPHWAQEQEIVDRFVREAQAAAMLKHPNVCAVSDVGITDDGAPYMILEYLDGQSLADILKERGTLAPQELYRYLGPIMTAVAFAHDQGVVHRDLKPDNIFVSRQGSDIVPKVLDFGIAKLSIEQSSGKQTTAPIGTVLYMSPEQAMVKDIGPWCDVWSMGVIMYEALSGRFPFDFPPDAGIVQMISIVIGQKPVPLTRIGLQLPAQLLDVVDKALSVDPRARYRHMRELDAAFRKTLDRISGVNPLGDTGRPDSNTPYISNDLRTGEIPGGRSSRAPLIAVAGIGVLGLVGVGSWMALGSTGAPTVDGSVIEDRMQAAAPEAIVPDAWTAPDAGAPAHAPIAHGVEPPAEHHEAAATTPPTEHRRPHETTAARPTPPTTVAAVSPPPTTRAPSYTGRTGGMIDIDE